MRRKLFSIIPLVLVLVICPHANASEQPAACAKPPSTMRAARVHGPGGSEALRIEQVPVPAPAAGEVLVRVHFASVNPVDWKLMTAGRLPYPAIPGGDFAGEVVATGANAATFTCGALVAGVVNQRERGGSYAEYVVVPVSEIVPKPGALSLAEAAAYPTVAVAAWRYLVEAAAVQSGERVLVHGGAGGVGSVVVQIAKARGAYVIATASAGNHVYLRGIGADETIDYRSTRFEDVVRDVDIVVDTVGGETLTRSVGVLRDGGRLVSLAGVVPAETCAAGRIICPATPPWDVQRGLSYVAPLIATGKLRINIDRRYPLEAIAEAVEHNRSGRTRGKVVVDLGVDQTPAATVPLQAYLDGHATGLERHFRRVFAPDAMLVGIKDGKYRQWPASEYIAASSSGRTKASVDAGSVQSTSLATWPPPSSNSTTPT